VCVCFLIFFSFFLALCFAGVPPSLSEAVESAVFDSAVGGGSLGAVFVLVRVGEGGG
jgi:hypothetical protein